MRRWVSLCMRRGAVARVAGPDSAPAGWVVPSGWWRGLAPWLRMAALALVVMGASVTGARPVTTPPAAPCAPAAESVRTVFGFILGIDLSEGVLLFDEAEWLTGAEAVEAAIADGVVSPGTTDMPNAFYLRNPGLSTVPLAVSPDATVVLNPIQTDEGPVERHLDLEGLAAAFTDAADPEARALRDAPYHLELVQDVVVEIREQYVP